ncbi:MAG: hypothetical protein GF307_01830 [candidate division Zixibacteria bacterium]|nr:hypothetical protein [candidate division Zixibacteria bacterium]
MRSYRGSFRECREDEEEIGLRENLAVHSLVILAQRAGDVSHEDIWHKIENDFVPLIEELPYHRGYTYKVVIGKVHGDVDADAIIEAMFMSMDDLERAAKSEKMEQLIEKSKGVFDESTLRVLATHQM